MDLPCSYLGGESFNDNDAELVASFDASVTLFEANFFCTRCGLCASDDPQPESA